MFNHLKLISIRIPDSNCIILNGPICEPHEWWNFGCVKTIWMRNLTEDLPENFGFINCYIIHYVACILFLNLFISILVLQYLSMKLAAVNPRIDFNLDTLISGGVSDILYQIIVSSWNFGSIWLAVRADIFCWIE